MSKEGESFGSCSSWGEQQMTFQGGGGYFGGHGVEGNYAFKEQ